MDDDFKVLHPIREVQLDSQRTITVREMRWKDAVAFAEKLSGLLGQFTSPDGRLVITPERIAAAITSSGALATDLVSRSGGMSPEEVGDLAPAQVLELLAAALEVNLHPDLLGKARRVGQSLQAALGGAVTLTAAGVA